VLTSLQLASYIDHTCLRFDFGSKQEDRIIALCNEAKEHSFAAVCVLPEHVRLARKTLGASSPIQLACVVGFPRKQSTIEEERAYPELGAVPTTTKLQEISMALSEGADELDVVMNVAYFKTDLEVNGDFTSQEFEAFKQATDEMASLKLIIETDLLNEAQVQAAVRLVAQHDLTMVKTCTGMIKNGQGATPELVRLMRQILVAEGKVEKIGLKASGGIRTKEQALALIEAGANRIGSSNAIAMM
jgi:deoxyribose-phosphate aldolase